MSTYNINMREFLRTEFQINTFAATQAVADKVFNDFNEIPVIPTDSPLLAKSQQGIPVWDYIRILPKTISGTGEAFEGYDFPSETVVEAVLPKKVAETEIFGRDGIVEELMGLSDWEISIRGFIINYESTDYPEDKVRALKRLCELKDSELEVEGTFLNMLDINYISFRNLRLPASTGFGNMQTFEIEARSKIPFVINRTNGILL